MISNLKTKLLSSSACFALIACLVPQISMAEANENPFAECGIGGALFPKNETAAIVSNIIWDLGTTALTSGFTTPDSCSGGKAKTALFIYESYDLIAEQTVKGSGEHLTAMLNLAGCESELHKQIIRGIRADFSGMISDQSYSSKNATDQANEYYNALQASASGICSLG